MRCHAAARQTTQHAAAHQAARIRKQALAMSVSAVAGIVPTVSQRQNLVLCLPSLLSSRQPNSCAEIVASGSGSSERWHNRQASLGRQRIALPGSFCKNGRLLENDKHIDRFFLTHSSGRSQAGHVQSRCQIIGLCIPNTVVYLACAEARLVCI